MSNHWIFVVTNEKHDGYEIPGIDIFRSLIKKKIWGLGEKTGNRKYVKRGDRVIFYCSRENQTFSYTFLGTAKVEKAPKLNPKRDHVDVFGHNIATFPYEVILTNIKIWTYPKPIKPLIKKLSFIKKADRWGTYLQVGVISITGDDYKIIVKAEENKQAIPILEDTPQIMGKKFENKIFLFCKKMKFKDLDTRQIIGREVDVIGGVDNHLFFIEYKWMSKSSSSKAKDHIDQIRAKIYQWKKAAKKHPIYSKYSNHVFVLATNNHKVNEEHHKYGKKANRSNWIFIWDPRFVEYYQRFHQVVGSYAVYNILGEMDIKPDSEQPFRIPAFRTKFGRYKLYHFVINPKQMLKYCYVARREIGREEYYQRMLKPDKINNIKRFIDNQTGGFSNNVILNINDKPIFHPLQNVTTQEEWPTWIDFGMLQFPKNYRSLWIIDGQHRLYGFSKSDNTHPIPVAAFDRLKVDEHAKLFIDINENQTPVGADLLWDLQSKLRPGKEEGIISKAVKEINEKSLQNKVYIPLLGKKKGTKLKLSGVCNAIKRYSLIKKHTRNMKHKTNPLYTTNPSTRGKNLKNALDSYFLICQDLFDKSLTENFFYTNGGIRVLIYIYERLLTRFGRNLNKNKMSECVQPLVDYLKISDVDTYLAQTNSEAGSDDVVEVFVSVIANKLKDDELLQSVKRPKYHEDVIKLERELAEFMNFILSEKDSQWGKHMVQNDVYQQAKSNFEKRPPEDKRDQIYQFFTLGQLKNILFRKDVFEYFKDYFIGKRGSFSSKDEMKGALDRLIKYRNPPSHGEILDLDPNTLDLIKKYIITFKRCILS